jgi:hypothetical protein
MTTSDYLINATFVLIVLGNNPHQVIVGLSAAT